MEKKLVEIQDRGCPEFINGVPIGEILRSIAGLRHGQVQIIVQDSKVIQIDKTEKKRIDYKAGADRDYSI